jgi:alanyl-tRNA synthetase
MARTFKLAGKVGHYVDAETGKLAVVSGTWLFSLMDSKGLPLDFLLDELKARGLAFNVQEFIDAALKSKNFKPKRLFKMLTEYQAQPHPDAVLGIALYIKLKTGEDPRDG